MSNDLLLDKLRTACKGLLFPSESEAPLEPIAWKSDTLNAKRVLELTSTEPGTTVDETTLADLWQTIPNEDRARFDALRKTLESLLSGIKVYKIGEEAEKTVYIVGKATDARWAGLKTSVVET
jgi:hypothetical protein